MGEELERRAEDLTEYIRSLKLTENEHMEFMKKVTDYKECLKRHRHLPLPTVSHSPFL